MKKVSLVELDLAESCRDQVMCSRCPKKQDCETYNNFYYIVNRATKSSLPKIIHVHYDSEYTEELHVSVKKEDFDDLVARANGEK